MTKLRLIRWCGANFMMYIVKHSYASVTDCVTFVSLSRLVTSLFCHHTYVTCWSSPSAEGASTRSSFPSEQTSITLQVKACCSYSGMGFFRFLTEIRFFQSHLGHSWDRCRSGLIILGGGGVMQLFSKCMVCQSFLCVIFIGYCQHWTFDLWYLIITVS